jgi:hypothetical protein
MNVNDNAYCLIQRGVASTIASKLRSHKFP